jgi:hypothetical protein
VSASGSGGYRVSQLFPAFVDPREILEQYRAGQHPDKFYNLKIGIPWADLERRVDVQTTLALCRSGEAPKGFHVMGVDTGKQLHVVVLRTNGYQKQPLTWFILKPAKLSKTLTS